MIFQKASYDPFKIVNEIKTTQYENKGKHIWVWPCAHLLIYVSFLHTEGYRRIDVYSQGEFPGRVWGCRYQLWVASSCLWFLEHLSASRWTHPVCWQNPASANTQTHQHSQTQKIWLLWHQKPRNIKIWTNHHVLHHNTTNRTSEK